MKSSSASDNDQNPIQWMGNESKACYPNGGGAASQAPLSNLKLTYNLHPIGLRL